MEQKTSYLNRLRFDPKLKNSFIAKYLTNPRLLILFVLAILVMGITSFTTLPRTLNPQIKIPIVLITDVLPGAGPDDVESLVTIPIEDAVSGLDRVKTVTSTSRDSVSVVNLEFESGVDPERARADVQSAVDSVNLPEDAQAARVIKLDFENQPVWTFNLTGKGDDPASLMRYARRLRDELKELPSIERADTSGLEEQEVQILLKPEAITTYGINPQSLAGLISAATGSFPAGSVNTSTSSFSVTIDPSVHTVNDFRELKLHINGQVVALSQIATISQRSKPSQAEAFLASEATNPKRSVTFYVFKTGTSNIDKAVADAQKTADESLKKFNDQFTISTVSNTGEEITKQFDELLRDFGITILLIVIVLFIFLGVRQALVAALSVPMTFLITFTVMQLTGITLNFLSMFSLLLSLGLLVDDTIVVISAMTAYHRSGKFTPLETGLLVWRDFLVAIFTTTITTVWAFLPLLLSSGLIGEFIKSIPIVVSTTLLASFIVGMFITLPFIIILLRPNIPHRVRLLVQILFVLFLIGLFFAIVPKGPILILEILAFVAFMLVTHNVRVGLTKEAGEYYQKQKRKRSILRQLPQYMNHGVISFERISDRYKRLIGRILASQKNRRMTIIMVAIFSIFSYVLLPLGFVKNEFFPKSDSDFLYVSVELPAGSNLAVSKKEGLRLVEELRQTKESEFITLDLGRSIDSQSGGSSGGESNNILFTIKLLPGEERHTSSIDRATQLREKYANYDKGKLSVIEQSGGPPAGADVQIKLFGDDLQTLDSYANRVQEFLENQPGVTNVDKSIKPGTSKLVFTPDKQKMAEANLTQDATGFWLRFLGSGFSPESIKLTNELNEKRDITIRLSSEAVSPESLSALSMPTPQGPIPLVSLGSFTLKPNPTLITRENGKRTISVVAGITQGYSISDVNKELEKFANEKLDLPTGYSWATGGVNEENNKSVQSILTAMMLSFLLIIVTMVLQFGSFRKALIVMLVIPLSVSGVFIIFALTSTPLSFPALIGMLALFGIVVKNSILLVDKIKQNIDTGMDFTNALVDGSASRLEAIALTSVCAIIGLIPITLSDPLWRGLGGAIIAGLTFSGTIMLFFIPVVYWYWFHKTEGKK